MAGFTHANPVDGAIVTYNSTGGHKKPVTENQLPMDNTINDASSGHYAFPTAKHNVQGKAKIQPTTSMKYAGASTEQFEQQRQRDYDGRTHSGEDKFINNAYVEPHVSITSADALETFGVAAKEKNEPSEQTLGVDDGAEDTITGKAAGNLKF